MYLWYSGFPMENQQVKQEIYRSTSKNTHQIRRLNELWHAWIWFCFNILSILAPSTALNIPVEVFGLHQKGFS